MAAAKARFLFDTDFGAPKQEAEPRIPLADHDAAVAAAEARGHARGRAEAIAERVAETERQIAFGLDRVADAFCRVLAALPPIEARLEREAVDVAVAVARKLSTALIAREPMAELTTLIADCFAELRSTPHIVVRVNDALLAPLKERLDRLASEAGFTGRLVLLAEPSIAVGDGRVEWADGGVVLDSAATLAKVDELVQRFIAARATANAAANIPGGQS
ncbi:FliH/SctL family protein [Blastochloris viridis]|uniref:FlbE protein n=1 Tax=Blastochloris viridis TaxID=1079 RepID=A0A182D2W3_BLAVI|nr:FliH/SctL family protein [Blastochloris viridis]ALK10355.1 flagellar assembly protein H [Blastochloris viridis]BAR99708.1 FlbE protein [Blastochloris viridis]